MSRSTAAAAESNPLDELVPAVSPISVWQIERLADRFLEEYQPDMLCRPEPLDVVGLVKYLPFHQITIAPATADELGDAEALMRCQDYPEIEILLCEDQWEGLHERTDSTHRAKTSVTHELGHALLHAEQLHRLGSTAAKLVRAKRRDLAAFKDPEWQAWTWAGMLLMPRRILTELDELTPEYVGEVYDVSPEMARYHLRLLKRNRML